jgi:Zn-dependent protease
LQWSAQEFIHRAIVWGPVILFSLTVHEYFHAWTAFRFGDTTARDHGRLTLNPLAHLDLVGTIVMVISQFSFGWAKPVPVDLRFVRNPRMAEIYVSAAGPASNLGLAVLSGVAFQMFVGPLQSGALAEMLQGGVIINLALALFNLIPVFPLDGSHILANLLPPKQQETFLRFNQYAPFLLLLIVITGVFWKVAGPIVSLTARVLLGY